jgi:hypothetical protein
MKHKLLEYAQEHGDAAFLQGYIAHTLGIEPTDRATLAKMPEALLRIEAYQKLFDTLKTVNPKEVLSFYK